MEWGPDFLLAVKFEPKMNVWEATPICYPEIPKMPLSRRLDDEDFAAMLLWVNGCDVISYVSNRETQKFTMEDLCFLAACGEMRAEMDVMRSPETWSDIAVIKFIPKLHAYHKINGDAPIYVQKTMANEPFSQTPFDNLSDTAQARELIRTFIP